MLPVTDRLLLGPGPSPVSQRVMAALSAPPRSHLDPDVMALLDDIRARLGRVFRAPVRSGNRRRQLGRTGHARARGRDRLLR
jgi:aspartate aminotransferase-like enzyme